MTEYLWKFVRRTRHGDGVDVCGALEQRTGVLAGQVLTQYIDTYPTLAAAMAAHPDVIENAGAPGPVSLTHLPDEDDPVPGGMYSDDWEE